MNRDNNHPQIIGAFILGIAIVATAYLAGNFGRPSGMFNKTETAAVNTSDLKVREPIPVSDADNNGIEDWRDVLLDARPATVIKPNTETTEPYELPTTLTGQMGIEMIEGMLMSRMSGYAGISDDELSTELVEKAYQDVYYDLYNSSDIIIVDDSDIAIKVYANEAALILQGYDNTGNENAIDIYEDYINTEDPTRLDDLDPLITALNKLRDRYLNTPVPKSFAQAHTDLINVINAIAVDIDGFKQINVDPVVTLVRLQRYEVNVASLEVALQNMALTLEPHSDIFTADDPAFLFVFFHPNFEL
ncbi:hypothetical protein KC723_00765 [Candidatus Kaiserbacteria bacterium]|nr:hypothetical protein [Candidatus Kaiserbacteria bacterium]